MRSEVCLSQSVKLVQQRCKAAALMLTLETSLIGSDDLLFPCRDHFMPGELPPRTRRDHHLTSGCAPCRPPLSNALNAEPRRCCSCDAFDASNELSVPCVFDDQRSSGQLVDWRSSGQLCVQGIIRRGACCLAGRARTRELSIRDGSELYRTRIDQQRRSLAKTTAGDDQRDFTSQRRRAAKQEAASSRRTPRSNCENASR